MAARASDSECQQKKNNDTATKGTDTTDKRVLISVGKWCFSRRIRVFAAYAAQHPRVAF